MIVRRRPSRRGRHSYTCLFGTSGVGCCFGAGMEKGYLLYSVLCVHN